jgi:hypothetical protein
VKLAIDMMSMAARHVNVEILARAYFAHTLVYVLMYDVSQVALFMTAEMSYVHME